MKNAPAPRMPLDDFRQLQCWQLAHALRVEVIAICAKEAVARDFRFCNSFRDAASSVCRNIAEGFCRYRSAEIVLFFGYALSSLAEVCDHLEECRARGFLQQPEFERLCELAEHARAKILRFRRVHQGRRRQPGST